MLRHQLNVYQRRQPRPKLRPMDRFLWAWVSRIWPGWREELTLARISHQCVDTWAKSIDEDIRKEDRLN